MSFWIEVDCYLISVSIRVEWVLALLAYLRIGEVCANVVTQEYICSSIAQYHPHLYFMRKSEALRCYWLIYSPSCWPMIASPSFELELCFLIMNISQFFLRKMNKSLNLGLEFSIHLT